MRQKKTEEVSSNIRVSSLTFTQTLINAPYAEVFRSRSPKPMASSSSLKRCPRRRKEGARHDKNIPVSCPTRAMFRDVVRAKLDKENLSELSEQLYPSRFTTAEQQLIADCPVAMRLRQIADRVAASEGAAIDSLCAQLKFPNDPSEARRAVASVSERVMVADVWGRLLVLTVFSASVACRCAGRGPEYTSALLDQLEDYLDERIHDFLEKAETRVSVLLEHNNITLSLPTPSVKSHRHL